MTTTSSLEYAPPNDKHVGILGMQVYVPSTYILQKDLEDHAGVAAGKYTLGLGQVGLSIVGGDVEDINSIALTVVHSLLEKYNIDPMLVGRLEVGTETLVDKSKSTKTVLMELFENNTNIEGATIINACYGGTAALFNAFAWAESDAWSPTLPYAIVVAADIATYARGPARPTSGVGAVAMLVGRDAPLAFDPRMRATHASNVWDFYKPNHAVEYPTVDGGLSQQCYYEALQDVYERLIDKVEQFAPNKNDDGVLLNAETPDYWVFHAPYNKLVQKSYARLYLLDARRQYAKAHDKSNSNDSTASVNGDKNDKTDHDSVSTSDAVKNGLANNTSTEQEQSTTKHALSDWLEIPLDNTYTDRKLEAALKTASAASFKQRLTDANAASKLVGNTYTASVFLGLASLIDRLGRSKQADASNGHDDANNTNQLTPGKTLGVFSYGSGAIASMYLLYVREPSDEQQRQFTIQNMAETMQLTERLASRELVHPSELDHALETRARMHRAGAPYTPLYPTVGRLFPGTYYLKGIDAHWRRGYGRVPIDAGMIKSLATAANDNINHTNSELFLPLAPPEVVKWAHHEAVSHPVTGKLKVLASAEEGNADKHIEARRRVACVITGTAAGLPGREPVFANDNLDRLVRGDQCITELPDAVKESMLEKNVVHLVKHKDGTTKRIRVDNHDGVIKLAARLGDFCLTNSYGVPIGLAQTMDLAAQVAVAAGLEAMKNSGLLKGTTNDPKDWMLPEQYRNTTGVVYASSFPAMDAAVGEVMRFLQSKTFSGTNLTSLVDMLRERMRKASPNGVLDEEDEATFARLIVSVSEMDENGNTPIPYEFDRKFLFRVLVLGNAQLAQIAGCRGPNTQTNAACAGTTQAIAMAQDMLISGRAERVVVVAGDNASGNVLMPWLGSGFRALGAATTADAVADAACPFDIRRSGLLLGAGGIGMVLETELSTLERQKLSPWPIQIKARLLATQYSNSAYHGAALDRQHIGAELVRFLNDIELMYGITKADICAHGVYFSHETSTHASAASSCSGNEVSALRHALGDELLSQLLICNTKGFTGHPMGVSFEDVAAVEVLFRQVVPPVVNTKEVDPYLGSIKLSKGGEYACKYALRFAAGFGSQVAFALYATENYE